MLLVRYFVQRKRAQRAFRQHVLKIVRFIIKVTKPPDFCDFDFKLGGRQQNVGEFF